MQASKDVSNYYASWDLMELSTLSNLVALAEEICCNNAQNLNADLTEEQFKQLVLDIFKELDLFSRWKKGG